MTMTMRTMRILMRTTQMRCRLARHVLVFAPIAVAIAEWHLMGKLSTEMGFSISEIAWPLRVCSNNSFFCQLFRGRVPTHVPLCFPIGNILTVADDLLKNDGQKFLEMMEQLAERRMQREQQAAQDLEEDSDAGDDDEGDEDDEDDDDEDDDDEDDDEEEVCSVKHSFSPCRC